MTRTKRVRFGELRSLLRDLQFVEKATDAAWVFRHAKEGLLVFRRYADDEPIDQSDLISARKFLDMRGLCSSEDFEAFLRHRTTPA